MTGQYISLTPGQEVAFRHMAEKAMKNGDEAFVAFVEADGHEVYLEVDQLADLAEKAAEAYDRIAVREQAEKAARAEADRQDAEQTDTPRIFTEEETRANAARVISRYEGFEAVADAMEANLDKVDAKTLVQVGQTIAEAMKATRKNDHKWVFHSWVRDAMRRIRDQAFAMANERAERMVFIFLAPLLNVWRILSAERIASRDLEMAERMFGQARPSDQWAPWALKALERLITASHPDLYEVSVELASEIRAGLAEYRGASALINGMMARIPGLMDEARKANHRRTEQKNSERRARQLARNEGTCDQKRK